MYMFFKCNFQFLYCMKMKPETLKTNMKKLNVMSTVLKWKKYPFCDFVSSTSCVYAETSVCRSKYCCPGLFFTECISSPHVTMICSVLAVIMTFCTGLKVFSLSSSHSICVDIQKRPNMQEQQEEVSKGHCCSYTTFSSLTLCVAVLMCLQGKHNTQTQNNSPAVGKSVLRNNLVGGCFFSTNQSFCFWLLLKTSKNCFVFHSLAEALFWYQMFWKNTFNTVSIWELSTSIWT